jgi:hypothetical protein
LAVAPASRLSPAQVHLAPVPARHTLQAVLAGTINEPFQLMVHPLFVSTSEAKPGGTITVAATHLGTVPQHAALFILQGPHFRAEKLVEVGDRVAAGVVTLPTRMNGGAWYFLVQDASGITVTGDGKDTGSIIVDVGRLSVKG